MAAPKGNQFWKQRTKHGRDKLFADADILWDACAEYFEWVDSNPLIETVVKTPGGKVEKVEVPKMRAMTIGGLCIFLDIDQKTWFEYAKLKDFSNITARATEIIRTQKFEGASADLLNANIIARDLGLRDSKELSGPGGGPVQVETAERPQVSKKEWLALHGLTEMEQD